MSTIKKNQHYIPRFYLKNFSFQANKKQIGVFNVDSEYYFPTATLKHQGSKNFFYGNDGVVEDRLSKMETSLANVIKNIVETRTLPEKFTDAHFDLLMFAALTDARNPVQIENAKTMFQEIQKSVLDIDPNADLNQIFPNTSHDDIIGLSLSNLRNIVRNTIDLDFKLLINNTTHPFICSDFPIVRYNQFLHWKKWPQAKIGFAQTGLQIVIPLNSELSVVFFDSAIYKVGNKRDRKCEINKPADIDSINILQFVHCFESIYFDEKGKEDYIRRLYMMSKRYKRANIVNATQHYLFENPEHREKVLQDGFKNLLILNASDPNTNFSIDAIKMHSSGRSYALHPSMSQLRKFPASLKRTEDFTTHPGL